jgi:hypothetical protein
MGSSRKRKDHHCPQSLGINTMTSVEKKSTMAVAEGETLTTPPAPSEVGWWKQPYLRQLYLLMPFLFLGSTTLGYDGSVLNGLQTMTTWQDCKKKCLGWENPRRCQTTNSSS